MLLKATGKHFKAYLTYTQAYNSVYKYIQFKWNYVTPGDHAFPNIYRLINI